MKARSLNLVWGIILILAGGLFLAQNLGYLEELPLNTWVIIFSVLSLLFFATYFINGVKGMGLAVPGIHLCRGGADHVTDKRRGGKRWQSASRS